MGEKIRKTIFYKDFGKSFIRKQPIRVKEKILWTLDVIESHETIPKQYLKKIIGTKGLYEVRIAADGNIYRLFCFFEENNHVVICNGFQKKTNKTPYDEIIRALRIIKEYYDEKE
jgi:phage-related protein